MKKQQNEMKKLQQEQTFLDQLQYNLLPKMKHKEKTTNQNDFILKQQKLSVIDPVNNNNYQKRNSQGFVSLQSKIDSIQNNLYLDQTNYDGIQQQVQEELLQLDYQNKYDPANIDPSKYKKLNFLESYKQMISTNMARTLESVQNSKGIRNEWQQIQRREIPNEDGYPTNLDNIKHLNSQLRKINTNSNFSSLDQSNYHNHSQYTSIHNKNMSYADQRKRSNTKPELIVIYPTKEEVRRREAQSREREIQHNNIQINQLLYPQDQCYIQQNTFLKTEAIQQQNNHFEEDQAQRIMKNIERYQNQVLKPSNCGRSKLVPKMIQDRTLRLFTSNTPSIKQNQQKLNTEQNNTSNPNAALATYFTSHIEEQQNALEQLGYPISYRTKTDSNIKNIYKNDDFILPEDSNSSKTTNFTSNNIYHKGINIAPFDQKQNKLPNHKQQTSFDQPSSRNSYLEYQNGFNIHQDQFLRQPQDQLQQRGDNYNINQNKVNNQIYDSQTALTQNIYNEDNEQEENNNNMVGDSQRREMELMLQQHFNDKKGKKQYALQLPDITSPAIQTQGLRSRDRQNSIIKSTRSQSVASKSYTNHNHNLNHTQYQQKKSSRTGSPFNKKCNEQCDSIYKQCCDLVEI